jgi:hypothetical protein
MESGASISRFSRWTSPSFAWYWIHDRTVWMSYDDLYTRYSQSSLARL